MFSIAVTIGMIFGLRWLGMKGIIGLFIGMMFMAYMFLSKNPVMMFMVKRTEGETYIDEIKK